MENTKMKLYQPSDFSVLSVAQGQSQGGDTVNHPASFFDAFLYVSKGSASLLCHGEEIVLGEGEYCFIPTGCEYSSVCENSVAFKKVIFSVSFLPGRDYFAGLSKIVSFPTLPAGASFEDFHNPETAENSLLSKLALAPFLSALLKTCPEAPTLSLSDATAKALSFVSTHRKSSLTVHEVSVFAGLPDAPLSKLFKDEVGLSLAETIENAIMTSAEEKLVLQTASVGEIAESFGYCDQFYFARRFKARFGITPTEYRKTFSLI